MSCRIGSAPSAILRRPRHRHRKRRNRSASGTRSPANIFMKRWRVRKIRSTTAFNVILNEAVAGGLPRPDGMRGCMVTIRPGINLVPDELLDHPYLRSYIAAGAVTVPG